ncbi:MAG: hypothetical protein JETCAE03_34900 [Ignavibacteriaceae bacterium]|jgi:hypothetical protein|nr:MAG: hypothetical protein JETCAE03_34900 [Ignavibacteriaceae bacterium]
MKIKKLDIVKLNNVQTDLEKFLEEGSVWSKLYDDIYLFNGTWELDLDNVDILGNLKEIAETYLITQLLKENENKQ